MKHISNLLDDVPAAPFLMDRRRTPDRRTIWRGGRRDGDWHNRPMGAWVRVGAAPPGTGWRRILASLNLW